MPKSIIISILVLFAIPSMSQNQPVPDYLVKHSFPDSVLNIPVVGLDGMQGTFGDMLKSFQGRRVVLDIWGSWCRDCIVGLPKLEALKKTTDPEKVVYVFLSVDEDDKKWRAAINRFFRIAGEHYRIPQGWKNALSNYIVLDWVPRYMTLNEDGRVVMPKAIEAGEKRFVESVR